MPSRDHADGPLHHDPFPGFPVDSDVTREADVPPPLIHGPATLVVAAGGALGALCRWLVAEALPDVGGGFPWDVLLVNLLGCLLIGVLMVLVVEKWPDRPLVRPFAGTGVLGGFTTFSAYVADARALVASGHAATAVAFVVVTLAGGLVAVVAGLRLTERAVA
jgi:CrcB protein